MNAELKAIRVAIASAPGFFIREEAERALERLKTALDARKFERTQREFLAADMKALAEGKPVTTDLGKAVEARMAKQAESARACACGRELVGGSVGKYCSICWNAP